MTATKRARMNAVQAIRHLTQRVCESVSRGDSTGRDFEKLARLRRRRDRQRECKVDRATARLNFDFASNQMRRDDEGDMLVGDRWDGLG